MLTVFVTGEVNDAQLAQIRDAAPDADVRYFATGAALEAQIEDAEVVAGALGPRALARAARLRWVQTWAAGPDALMYPEMVASPVVCTSCKGNGAVPLAEHALLLMLLLNRDARRWLRAQEAHHWERFSHPELNGLTCGIIGLGHSGQDLALKCQAFHMRVLGMRRTPRPTPHVDEVLPRERLPDLLAASDFVVATAPLTPETRGMLGEAEFRAMRPTAYFICFSRGGIADDGALLRALQERWIAGAGLDAHGEEPLPADSPFWDLPNVIVTPHNGATTPATRQRGVDIFVENLRRYRAGRPLVNIIDKQAGY
ncbi:MAG TPA: D-2-hydroxyacid dehydrogenase [Thermomicrobiales bacterium]|nr:D-2-hydroxyacid dehydrogenase [Thermomicrobiales bacterium]